MTEQTLELKRRQKRRRKKARLEAAKLRPQPRRILARYKYHTYKWILAKDTGTLEELYARYGNKYQIWCGDLPPTWDANEKFYAGFRIDNDNGKLKRYAKHKAWVDPTYKINGKPVILVWNADDSDLY